MNQEKETFEYTYSAAQQEEIEKIRNKYLPKEDDLYEQIRKLDQSVTKKGTIWSIVVGVVGCLIFGAGLSACLEGGPTLFVPGIVLSVIGLIIMGLAYPIYQKLTKAEKERIAPIILEMTEKIK